MSTTTITYIGGPTAVLEYAGLRFITDPTFDGPGTYSEPGTTTLVKTAGPAIARTDLDPIDMVLLSHHSHRDNLDYEGLELIATGIPTLSTRDAATALFGGSVIGLDSWETYEFGPVTVTLLPALHGPPGSERLVGEVTGFMLEADGEPTVYVSGDNASLPLRTGSRPRRSSFGGTCRTGSSCSRSRTRASAWPRTSTCSVSS